MAFLRSDPLDVLRSDLNPCVVITDPTELAAASTDWRGLYAGRARAILRPGDVDEVARILAWASRTRTPVVPQGGNTSLSGGAVPDGSGSAVILTLSRLNQIRGLSTDSTSITVEAGCILADVQRYAREVDRFFPLSLGSEGTCQIGGTIATNAGGINALRYGTMRDLVLGLEFVLPDGRIVSKLKALRKNNAGYNLQQLVVGSEGTLAVITAAVLKLFPTPRQATTAICGLGSAEHALMLLCLLQDACGERLTSFEIMCGGELALIRRMMPSLPQPLEQAHAWTIFLELSDLHSETPLAGQLENILAQAFDRGIVADAAVAQTLTQRHAIWNLRFAVSECNRRAGYTVSHDTSVAVEDVPHFLEAVTVAVKAAFPEGQLLFVGHMGDGNIHVNVLFEAPLEPEQQVECRTAVNDCIFAVVDTFGGSITAEHGIGCSLLDRLPYQAGPVVMDLMRDVKRVFDPVGIMNPGKVLA